MNAGPEDWPLDTTLENSNYVHKSMSELKKLLTEIALELPAILWNSMSKSTAAFFPFPPHTWQGMLGERAVRCWMQKYLPLVQLAPRTRPAMQRIKWASNKGGVYIRTLLRKTNQNLLFIRLKSYRLGCSFTLICQKRAMKTQLFESGM